MLALTTYGDRRGGARRELPRGPPSGSDRTWRCGLRAVGRRGRRRGSRYPAEIRPTPRCRSLSPGAPSSHFLEVAFPTRASQCTRRFKVERFSSDDPKRKVHSVALGQKVVALHNRAACLLIQVDVCARHTPMIHQTCIAGGASGALDPRRSQTARTQSSLPLRR